MREIAGLDMSIEAAEDYGSRTDNNFQTGDFVVVMARTWIGINKPGGVGKILKIHKDEDGEYSYDVKYVVEGGRESNVWEKYVTAADPLAQHKPREVTGRCKVPFCPCFRRDCGHIQPDELNYEREESMPIECEYVPVDANAVNISRKLRRNSKLQEKWRRRGRMICSSSDESPESENDSEDRCVDCYEDESNSIGFFPDSPLAPHGHNGGKIPAKSRQKHENSFGESATSKQSTDLMTPTFILHFHQRIIESAKMKAVDWAARDDEFLQPEGDASAEDIPVDLQPVLNEISSLSCAEVIQLMEHASSQLPIFEKKLSSLKAEVVKIKQRIGHLFATDLPRETDLVSHKLDTAQRIVSLRDKLDVIIYCVQLSINDVNKCGLGRIRRLLKGKGAKAEVTAAYKSCKRTALRIYNMMELQLESFWIDQENLLKAVNDLRASFVEATGDSVEEVLGLGGDQSVDESVQFLRPRSTQRPRAQPRIRDAAVEAATSRTRAPETTTLLVDKFFAITSSADARGASSTSDFEASRGRKRSGAHQSERSGGVSGRAGSGPDEASTQRAEKQARANDNLMGPSSRFEGSGHGVGPSSRFEGGGHGVGPSSRFEGGGRGDGLARDAVVGDGSLWDKAEGGPSVDDDKYWRQRRTGEGGYSSLSSSSTVRRPKSTKMTMTMERKGAAGEDDDFLVDDGDDVIQWNAREEPQQQHKQDDDKDAEESGLMKISFRVISNLFDLMSSGKLQAPFRHQMDWDNVCLPQQRAPQSGGPGREERRVVDLSDVSDWAHSHVTQTAKDCAESSHTDSTVEVIKSVFDDAVMYLRSDQSALLVSQPSTSSSTPPTHFVPSVSEKAFSVIFSVLQHPLMQVQSAAAGGLATFEVLKQMENMEQIYFLSQRELHIFANGNSEHETNAFTNDEGTISTIFTAVCKSLTTHKVDAKSSRHVLFALRMLEYYRRKVGMIVAMVARARAVRKQATGAAECNVVEAMAKAALARVWDLLVHTAIETDFLAQGMLDTVTHNSYDDVLEAQIGLRRQTRVHEESFEALWGLDIEYSSKLAQFIQRRGSRCVQPVVALAFARLWFVAVHATFAAGKNDVGFLRDAKDLISKFQLGDSLEALTILCSRMSCVNPWSAAARHTALVSGSSRFINNCADAVASSRWEGEGSSSVSNSSPLALAPITVIKADRCSGARISTRHAQTTAPKGNTANSVKPTFCDSVCRDRDFASLIWTIAAFHTFAIHLSKQRPPDVAEPAHTPTVLSPRAPAKIPMPIVVSLNAHAGLWDLVEQIALIPVDLMRSLCILHHRLGDGDAPPQGGLAPSDRVSQMRACALRAVDSSLRGLSMLPLFARIWENPDYGIQKFVQAAQRIFKTLSIVYPLELTSLDGLNEGNDKVRDEMYSFLINFLRTTNGRPYTGDDVGTSASDAADCVKTVCDKLSTIVFQSIGIRGKALQRVTMIHSTKPTLMGVRESDDEEIGIVERLTMKGGVICSLVKILHSLLTRCTARDANVSNPKSLQCKRIVAGLVAQSSGLPSIFTSSPSAITGICSIMLAQKAARMFGPQITQVVCTAIETDGSMPPQAKFMMIWLNLLTENMSTNVITPASSAPLVGGEVDGVNYSHLPPLKSLFDRSQTEVEAVRDFVKGGHEWPNYVLTFFCLAICCTKTILTQAVMAEDFKKYILRLEGTDVGSETESQWFAEGLHLRRGAMATMLTACKIAFASSRPSDHRRNLGSVGAAAFVSLVGELTAWLQSTCLKRLQCQHDTALSTLSPHWTGLNQPYSEYCDHEGSVLHEIRADGGKHILAPFVRLGIGSLLPPKGKEFASSFTFGNPNLSSVPPGSSSLSSLDLVATLADLVSCCVFRLVKIKIEAKMSFTWQKGTHQPAQMTAAGQRDRKHAEAFEQASAVLKMSLKLLEAASGEVDTNDALSMQHSGQNMGRHMTSSSVLTWWIKGAFWRRLLGKVLNPDSQLSPVGMDSIQLSDLTANFIELSLPFMWDMYCAWITCASCHRTFPQAMKEVGVAELHDLIGTVSKLVRRQMDGVFVQRTTVSYVSSPRNSVTAPAPIAQSMKREFAKRIAIVFDMAASCAPSNSRNDWQSKMQIFLFLLPMVDTAPNSAPNATAQCMKGLLINLIPNTQSSVELSIHDIFLRLQRHLGVTFNAQSEMRSTLCLHDQCALHALAIAIGANPVSPFALSEKKLFVRKMFEEDVLAMTKVIERAVDYTEIIEAPGVDMRSDANLAMKLEATSLKTKLQSSIFVHFLPVYVRAVATLTFSRELEWMCLLNMLTLMWGRASRISKRTLVATEDDVGSTGPAGVEMASRALMAFATSLACSFHVDLDQIESQLNQRVNSKRWKNFDALGSHKAALIENWKRAVGVIASFDPIASMQRFSESPLFPGAVIGEAAARWQRDVQFSEATLLEFRYHLLLSDKAWGGGNGAMNSSSLLGGGQRSHWAEPSLSMRRRRLRTRLALIFHTYFAMDVLHWCLFRPVTADANALEGPTHPRTSSDGVSKDDGCGAMGEHFHDDEENFTDIAGVGEEEAGPINSNLKLKSLSQAKMHCDPHAAEELAVCVGVCILVVQLLRVLLGDRVSSVEEGPTADQAHPESRLVLNVLQQLAVPLCGRVLISRRTKRNLNKYQPLVNNVWYWVCELIKEACVLLNARIDGSASQPPENWPSLVRRPVDCISKIESESTTALEKFPGYMEKAMEKGNVSVGTEYKMCITFLSSDLVSEFQTQASALRGKVGGDEGVGCWVPFRGRRNGLLRTLALGLDDPANEVGRLTHYLDAIAKQIITEGGLSGREEKVAAESVEK